MASITYTGIFQRKIIVLGISLLSLSKMVSQWSLEDLLNRSFGKAQI